MADDHRGCSLDIIDARILFQAGFKYHLPSSMTDRRPDSETISRELGIDPPTVRSRLAKMEKDGLIEEYHAIPNYSALGYRLRTYLMPFPDPLSKDDVVAKIKLVDGITRIDEYGNSLAFTILFKSDQDLKEKLSQARELTGKKSMTEMPDQEVLLLEETRLASVPTSNSPSVMDCLALRSIRYNALKPEQEIAKDLGISTEMARQQLRRLVDSNLFFVLPVFSTERLSKLTFYALLFIPDSTGQEIVDQISAMFKDDSYYRIISQSDAIIFLMFAQNIAEAEANYSKAQKILGIRVVLIDFAGKTHHLQESIDKIIDTNIST